MFYARVPERLDQYTLWPYHGNKTITLIGGELLTYNEYMNMQRKYENMPRLSHWIILKKTSTIWFMGARLPIYTATGRETGIDSTFEEVWNHYHGIS